MRVKKAGQGIRRAGMASGIPMSIRKGDSNDRVGRNDQRGREEEEGVRRWQDGGNQRASDSTGSESVGEWKIEKWMQGRASRGLQGGLKGA